MIEQLDAMVREGIPRVGNYFRDPGAEEDQGAFVDRVLKAAGICARIMATRANENGNMLILARMMGLSGEALRPLVPRILGPEFAGALPASSESLVGGATG